MVLFIGQNDGQIGAYDEILDARFGRFLHKPPKIRVHFRSSTGKVQSVRSGVADDLQTLFHGFPRHDFLSVGAGIYMAVRTDLIAHISHVDLEHFQLFGL